MVFTDRPTRANSPRNSIRRRGTRPTGPTAFTVELRPHTQADGGFILPPDQIQPTWEENRAAALEFIKRVL